MRYSYRLQPIALLLACVVAAPAPLSGQEPAEPARQTRPRRVLAPPPEVPAAAPFQPETHSHVDVSSLGITAEPFIRVGLTKDARSVTISTDGQLLHAADTDPAPVPLEAARVRVEPRSYPPITPAVEGAAKVQAAKADKSGVARIDSARDVTGETARDVNAGQMRRDGKLRLVARVSAPTRGAAVYAPTTALLFNVRSPITFHSGDELQHALRFNGKSYRGRMEVFANERGTLTVVNVVGLEDYVRGVVANELSPGGFPEIEALKAQAVAARTYALGNRGRFAADGFDLLPTTRSQVYGGRQTEHPLTDRAVAETRGLVATHRGEIINALYASTCGGRTEHAENIFGGEPVPYLRARECAADGLEPTAVYKIKSSRELPSLRAAEHLSSAREAALLAAHGFTLPPARLTDSWLSSPVMAEDVRALLRGAALLARRPAPIVSTDATRPPGFSTALAEAVDGESRGDVLLARADVDYLLSFRDADEIPARHRADVALLVRDGHIPLYPDATLRPAQPMPRARAIHTVARVLEARNFFRLQKAVARTAAGGSIVLRSAGSKDPDRAPDARDDAYLFRAFGEQLHQVREVALVGGETVAYHTNARGEIDYLEVRPAPNGAASDRFSSFTNWTATLSPAEVATRLARFAGRAGPIVDLRVAARGPSRRVLALEVVGAGRTARISGGRIRSALGLREQLFVIDRRYDEAGRLTDFVFTGRGFGHGVGMCQVGAYGMARAGRDYEQILKAYYTDISLTKLY